jgi:hypothetical protein
MRKIVKIILKVLPLLSLLTLYQGLTSQGGSLRPVMEVLRVSLTEYEITQVTKLLIKNAEATRTLLQRPQDFGQFIQNFYSQYSVFAREVKGDKKHDHSQDIWGVPFALITQNGVMKIASAGPDRILNTKDDIATEIQVRTPERVTKIIAPPPQPTAPAAPLTPVTFAYYDSLDVYDSEGFNREGFDKQGYDRDGYDRNGLHFTEKAIK